MSKQPTSHPRFFVDKLNSAKNSELNTCEYLYSTSSPLSLPYTAIFSMVEKSEWMDVQSLNRIRDLCLLPVPSIPQIKWPTLREDEVDLDVDVARGDVAAEGPAVGVARMTRRNGEYPRSLA